MACLVCGSTENLLRHHIDYELGLTVEICAKCHAGVHSGKIRPDLLPPVSRFDYLTAKDGVAVQVRLSLPQVVAWDAWVRRREEAEGRPLRESERLRGLLLVLQIDELRGPDAKALLFDALGNRRAIRRLTRSEGA